MDLMMVMKLGLRKDLMTVMPLDYLMGPSMEYQMGLRLELMMER